MTLTGHILMQCSDTLLNNRVIYSTIKKPSTKIKQYHLEQYPSIPFSYNFKS